MKRVIFFVALALCSVANIWAQNNTTCTVIGAHYNSAGDLVISDPSTTIQVQLTVEKVQTIVGPYAKYAQKFLDVRPALVGRTSYTVTDAKIGLAQPNAKIDVKNHKHTCVDSYLGSDTDFARVSTERTSSTIMSTEDAAQQAAQAIFSIRRHRMELITGEAGENVFGAGLKDALKALDKKEQEYMELFLGKKITTTTTHTYTIPLAVNITEYNIARINTQTGLQPATATEGDVIKLSLTPLAETKFNYITEVEPTNKLAVAVRIANISTCSVVVGETSVGNTATLPIYELGRTAYILNPAAKK